MAISPDAAAGGVAQLITVIGTYSYYGVVAAKYAINEHKKKVELEHIAEIKELYNKHLKDISVRGPNNSVLESLTLPEIFSGDKGEPQKASSLTEAAIADLNAIDPIFNDARLLKYGMHINQAMLELQAFYVSRIKFRPWYTGKRGSADDITSSVLSYLILNISSHCYVVQTHARTLAYLEGLIKFTNAFASLHGEKHDRFSRLTLVYSDLETASILLYANSLQMSYRVMLNEICPGLMAASKKLLRLCLQIITPNQDWKYVDTVLTRNIKHGILKRDYPHDHTGVGEIKIPDCIFKDWLKTCAEHYSLALSLEDSPEEKGTCIDGKKFEIVKLTKKQLNDIRSVFANSENFFTRHTVIAVDLKQNKWEPISEETQLTNRAKLYAEYMSLLDRLIAVIYYCAHMSNRVEQLGEIYVSNPHNCIYLFEVIHGLGKQTSVLSSDLAEKMNFLKKDNASYMPQIEIQSLFDNLRAVLTTINSSSVASINTLYERHRKYPGMHDVKKLRKPIEVENDIMMTIAQTIAEQYKIPTTSKPPTRLNPSPTTTPRNSINRGEMKYDGLSIDSDSIDGHIEESLNSPLPRDDEDNNIIPYQRESIISPRNIDDEQKSEIPLPIIHEDEIELEIPGDVDAQLANVHLRILQIERDEPDQREYNKLYKDLFRALSNLKMQADIIGLDPHANRQRKAQQIYLLVESLSAKIGNFLMRTSLQRIAYARVLGKDIEGELSKVKTKYLDKKKNWYDFFRTRSRNDAEQVKKVGHQLTTFALRT